MTMSDDHPEASVPLDLRIKTREITVRTKTRQLAHRTKTREIADQTAKVEEVDCTSKESPSHLPEIRTDSKEHKVLQHQSTGPSNQNRERDGKAKTSDLPFRKRPFRPDHTLQDYVKEPQAKVLKTQTSPSTAEAPMCGNVRNELETVAQGWLPSQAPAGTRTGCDLHIAQATPLCYAYFQCQPHRNAPFQTFGDADRLLSEVALATHQDEDGDTALHIAVAQEKETLVRRLIHVLRCAGHNLDLYNNLRQTPLHLAVITHQPGVVEALLQAGADPGALDRNGQTALHLCCEHRQDTCLSIILLYLSRSPCCSSLCLDNRNYEGLTSLHLAVQDGNKKLAQMLIDGGADINAVDIKSGRSPLVHAVENNCMEMVNFLVENGCNVNSQSYSGNTALHIACGRGEVEAVRILLKNGADSSLKNYHNDTAAMVAKNKKVSDVLRGKSTRGHTLNTRHNFNGTSSPNNLSYSPLATANFQRSPSLSPTTAHIHSPHSQPGESRSANLSPVETHETEELQMKPSTFQDTSSSKSADYVMSLHPLTFFPAAHLDTLMPPAPHIHMSRHPPYYPVQRSIYPSDTQFILIPTRSGQPACIGPPAHPTGTSPRPSSHNSEQSDISNMSASSEGKGMN